MTMNDKLQPEHLQRGAYVYVRQSTAQQVRAHREGQQQQYALADRARQLGFARVVIIDEDLGRSGNGLVDRPGFGHLLAAICGGEAGAVFALEASRLARNNRDWHHLLDLCAMTNTVLIDDRGVYDPRQVNDRLVLGLQGTMSEFELSLFRQRARQAFEQKVLRGHVLWEVAVGFVRTEEDRCQQTPDRQVQQAITAVFRKFRELGSARQTAIWYCDTQMLLPQTRPGTAGGEVVWASATESRVRQILKNPCYAGALAHGRTTVKTVIADGRPRQTGRRRKPQEQWKVLLLDNHSGYISWEEFQENQRILEANGAMREGGTGGAAKAGGALLSGLLRCGRCGRQMFVQYSGTTGRVPRYGCHGGRDQRGSAACLSLGAWRVDRAVVDQVLEAIQPAGVQAALLALERLGDVQREQRAALTLALEKARYEAGRAWRQYEAVDPENRLVAGELEKRWNDALVRVADVEQQLEAIHREQIAVTPEQRTKLLELGRDLPALWYHPAASPELQKRILRTVLREIVIDNREDGAEHVLALHWQGGVHTELKVKRGRKGQHRRVTEANALEIIRELSKVCTDATIAATLNRLGYRTGKGKTWRSHSVANVRYYHRLPNYAKGVDWLTVEQAAHTLEVSETVIRRLIKQRVLPAQQTVALAPWIIARLDLQLATVQAAVTAVRQGRQPRKTSPDQGEFPWK
jgi:DNA invertase Pin-like site-specific DNA recombinase